MIKNTAAEINAAIGMVKIQAPMIFRAIPHLTAESLSVAPTPMIDADITCVVLTGIPMEAITASTIPLEVSAQKPWYGRSRVTLCAIVFTILQPPENVPRPIAAAHDKITQKGIGRVVTPIGLDDSAISRIAMTPMVFWASFVPWVKE